MAEFKDSVRRSIWRKAALHRHGKGLESGFDPNVPSMKLKKLTKLGKTQEAGMLKTILTAGVWGLDRQLEAGLT